MKSVTSFKVKRKQIRNSQLRRNVNKKKKIGIASSEETSINGKKNDGTVNGMVQEKSVKHDKDGVG